MKNTFFIIALLCAVIVVQSCKDDNGTEISEKNLVIQQLTGNWSINSDQGVLLDNNIIADDFTDLTLMIDPSLNYTTNSLTLDRNPTPWPIMGSFHFGGIVDVPNLTQLIRDDGLEIDIVLNDNGTRLTMSFNFADENKDSNGDKTEAVIGNWIFEWVKL